MQSKNKLGYYTDTKVYEDLKKPEKYCGKVKQITTRSSLERKFIFSFLDNNPNIEKWANESVIIPYYSEVDGRKAKYYVDFYMKLKDGREYLIEVKPNDFLTPPKPPKRRTKKSLHNYQKLTEQYVKNSNKWEAAKNYVKLLKTQGRKIEFMFVTEKEILNG